MIKPTLILIPALMCNKSLFFNQIDKLKEFCDVVGPLIKILVI